MAVTNTFPLTRKRAVLLTRTTLASALFRLITKGATMPKPTHKLMEHDLSTRAAVEQFIYARFAASYGATVHNFMPRLLTLRGADGNIHGAFGLRPATAEQLFLETYLEIPIEAAISATVGQPVDRRRIVEIGNFAGASPGITRTMIEALTILLHHEGFEWVAFTGAAGLRNAFTRLQLYPIRLCAADPERLSASEKGHWGTYYDHAPCVYIGNIREGYAALQLRNQSTERHPTLFPDVMTVRG